MPSRRGIGNWYIASLEIPPDIADLLRQASAATGLAISQLARICIYEKVREIIDANKTVSEFANISLYKGLTDVPAPSPKSV